ncbi:unnamed protein product [Ceutorhynchus assimilis]|uniref:CHK kinase-like domain-containing protein n=1 Tax=Ceutorhynchus assimilis TaxID=467358 RepID=A0A9N9MKG9_9CUCU|nr:unnamed protein product [Ceutorhynchus assimilis]
MGADMCECFDEAVKALSPKSLIYDEVKDYTKYFKATYLKACEYSGKFKCLTHGDCWSNNMLFKYSQTGKLEDIKLIDFQLTRESSPIHDLSYFFYCGASKNDFANLESYLKIYHESLSNVMRQCGEDANILFPYKDLVREWKENALLGVFWGIHLWYIKLLPKEEYEQVLKGTDKMTPAEVQDFFKQLMRKTIASDAYKERASAILIHAYEFGVITKGKIVREN